MHRPKEVNRHVHVEWKEQRLGRRPDEVVQAELEAKGIKVVLETVRKARRALGIAPFVPPNTPKRGELGFRARLAG